MGDSTGNGCPNCEHLEKRLAEFGEVSLTPFPGPKERTMANAFTYKAATHRFDCGNDFVDLSVINFVGPAGAQACAYSCNMNLDLDGDPQSYGPFNKPKLRPKDNLGDAGWKSAADNTAIRLKYEAGKKLLSELEQKKVDLVAKSKPVPDPTKPAPDVKKTAPDPAIKALDDQIDDAKTKLSQMSYEHIDENGNRAKVNPKNFGKIFWKWYGLVALSPDKAKAQLPCLDVAGMTGAVRMPVLDKTSYYEDVYGRFPVVQSVFEPGPDYFVSALPSAATNPQFQAWPWDQRYFLPPDKLAQQSFGALSTGLASYTGLRLKDMVLAIRLDTGDSLAFPFLDSGNGYKVAECSFAAFTGLGGIYHPERERAAKFPNDFLLLYLAFPNSAGQTPAATLANFATASNALDFPIILAFIAKMTADTNANANGKKTVTGDPLAEFAKWKKLKPELQIKPDPFDTINQSLRAAGFNPATP